LKETAFGKPGARLKEQEKRAMKQPQHQIVGLIKQNPPGLREKVEGVMKGHLQRGTDPASVSDERERIAKAVLEILPDLSRADWVAFYIRNPAQP
jgi:hypothetical protein